ncbi:alpha/beta hydrolase [Singulisphaera sp. Ch08]|uniref:Alpha/beta hydrolase n=2 Tax=Singulisphaera sp. Ch08 TaxID=3120278 RepID=A0AAU7CF39_9BACT
MAFLVAASGVVAAEEPKTFPLWAKGAPGALGTKTGDEFHADDVPTITVYRPDVAKVNGGSIVICPGGGYQFLATEHEGKDVAEWARSLGLTAFVLKYRLAPQYKHPRMLEDAQRAIRTVRARASEWDLDPKRVAIIGFSAGGHLASTTATHFDGGKADANDPIERQSSRPDLAILIYPVIAMGTPAGHTGSLKSLLGENPPKELVESLSNETQVTKDTPPTFLAHTNEDNGVVPENSLQFALALRKAKVPVELHLFEKGQHGLGLGTGWADKIPPNEAFQAWPKLCATWLKGRGFLTQGQPATAK